MRAILLVLSLGKPANVWNIHVEGSSLTKSFGVLNEF